jgi:hypothetical protein
MTDTKQPPGWNIGCNYPGGDVLVYGPGMPEDVFMKPDQAVSLGLYLIRSAMDAMDAQQLKELGRDLSGLFANLADDYLTALHGCPRCGDGVHPERLRPSTRLPEGGE